MSVSKWAYTPEKCDGDYCIGDCDLCIKAEDDSLNAGCHYDSMKDYMIEKAIEEMEA